jgi:uncharacterized membrane protein YfcA
MADAFPALTLAQILLVAGTAFVASIIGGMAGYGTGLLLPLALVPIIGAEATVPAIAVTALFTNASRAVAQRHAIDWRRTALMLPLAIPLSILAAMFFVKLDGRGAAIMIGTVLVALVPLRRLLATALATRASSSRAASTGSLPAPPPGPE